MERKLVTVAVDGSAEFTTLTAAAAAQDALAFVVCVSFRFSK